MHTEETTKKPEALVCIQLLRALAALSVVYHHCATGGDYNFPSAGAFGVDIFFIISGFIIAYMVTKNTENFFIKRIIRIVPLYFIAIVVMTLTVIFFPNIIRSTTISLSGFIKSVLFIPGTENRGFPILGQGWTLNYEMFFYVIMFLCIAFVRNKKYLTIACSSIIVVILITVNLLHTENYVVNYYGNNLSIEFIFGMILYHFYDFVNKHTIKIPFSKNLKIILLSLLAIIGYGFLVFSDFIKFRISEYRCLFYGIPALMVIFAVLFLEKHIKKNKLVNFGIELGEASYVMYLIHYHVVILLSRVVFNNVIGVNNIFIIELMKIVIAYIVTMFFSIVIYRFIDKPIQKYFRRIMKNRSLGKIVYT